MKKNPTPPRTNRDALAALVLGEIDTLLDKLEELQESVNAAGENIKVTINSARRRWRRIPSSPSREFTPQERNGCLS
jgi:hypothetical protein